ncbi:MAG TPA: hypothetical protein VFU22_15850, partial [Roseiflexaceae bacterium]|nr:hypothetical protein [Roseiflexaceae bacterium]
VLLSLLSLPHARAEPQQFRAYLPLMRQTSFDLYASTGTQIIRYDGATGKRLNTVVSNAQAGAWPADFAFGPDENLYVSDGLHVQRYSPLTGDLLGTFIDLAEAGFAVAYNLAFGPDGNLYVAGQPKDSVFTTKVARFQGMTGIFIDNFIPQLVGLQPLAGDIHFGPNGDLYVLCIEGIGTRTYLQRYDGSSGAFVDTIIPINSQWLLPSSFTFGADDNIYAIADSARVLRFDGKTGGFLDTFIPADESHLRSAIDLTFGPNGNLYFVRQDTDQVLQYHGTTGAFINIFIEPELDHAIGSNRIVFYPKLAP